MLRKLIVLPRRGASRLLLAFIASTIGFSASAQEPPTYDAPTYDAPTSNSATDQPQTYYRPMLTPPTYNPPMYEPTWEPPANPAARMAMARANWAQIVRIRRLARQNKVDLNGVVQTYFHKQRVEDLSLSQAADLIVHLQRRPAAFLYSYPHTLRDKAGAEQDWVHNGLLWPLVWIYRL